MIPAPHYGWYGDDFTGATDTLATIARRGHRAFLFLSVPNEQHLAAAGPLDAIGIAGAARTMSPDTMRAVLPEAGHFFRDQGVRLLHYKCCSTFDSAPTIGNLAAAMEALSAFASSLAVPIIGGQPSLGRYCSFSNLFATAGDRVYRIDRHPTMSRHPATPMLEADLVRHFEALGLSRVAAIHWPSVSEEALERAWTDAVSTQPPAVLLDAIEDSQIGAIGALLRREAERNPILAVGASSVAEAWFAGFPRDQVSAAGDPVDGPVFAFIGSLSPVTRRQVAASRSYTVLQIAPENIISDDSTRAAVVDEAVSVLAAKRNVMVSTAPLDGPTPHSLAPGLATASAQLVEEIVHRSKVRRLAIAGGDTSTMAATALGFWGLAYHGLASRGSTICRGRHDDPARDGMLLLLKGGQMGDEQVFETFAETSQSSAHA
jgi:3-oxoisoapionate kinase